MNPTPLRHRLSGLAAATLLMATPALADWQADATTKFTPPAGQKAPPEMTGKIYGRKGVLRMDSQTPGPDGKPLQVSFIFNYEKRTGTTVMHTQKMVMERSLDDLPVKLPGSCTGKTQDFDACFKEQGYKKVGNEKVNGHSAVVYEGMTPDIHGRPSRQKVWRPTDLAEVPYIRAQTFGAGGDVTEVNLTNIQTGPVPDSRFTVPADYQKLAAPAPGAMPGGLKPEDLKGKTPEQIQELLRQRLGQGAPEGGKTP
ncbi:hypothetical protein HPC49_30535 [Pyxidicoccus fallax]|uniref:DUF4412 domain-containing protein n=1 Tax=Pyxidicoccus fallax TaxID=394095 RepID=A0A848LAD1_9BACT|nr:hypothetical protein [Pyxidicoccus fallax]NMO15557.1 hypothetical protein [Pyxidicoccus fallax]NPC82547.1 hypothetical protein [Pyxidicoccus fallax]